MDDNAPAYCRRRHARSQRTILIEQIQHWDVLTHLQLHQRLAVHIDNGQGPYSDCVKRPILRSALSMSLWDNDPGDDLANDYEHAPQHEERQHHLELHRELLV
jgi:hypothetical protein